MVPSQPLNRVVWSVPLALTEFEVPDYTHFTPPVVTRSNTAIFPMLLTNVYKIESLAGSTGQTNWEQATDFTGMSSTIPFCPVVLTPKNRLYFAGCGGTVFYCDSPDATNSPVFTRSAFYGLSQYLANTNGFNSDIHIETPITSDRYGDIFFGFLANSASPLGRQGGLARIDFDGNGTWISADNAIRLTNVFQPILNCAPALSLDQKTVYIAFSDSTGTLSYLTVMDSRTLAPLRSVRLLDPESQNPANTSDGSSATPTIGPDGDVYYGVEHGVGAYNYNRGWLLHFDSSLAVEKIPGLFGWDVTASVVSASLVPSYTGNSSYLLATKFNNYTTKEYSMAIFDPQQGVLDTNSGVTAMAVVLTVPSPARYEWCINSAAVDPFSKSILANNEDGNLYRWDLTKNQLTESVALTTSTSGEAYTPTVIGMDGIVYAINHSRLFAVGK